MRRARLILPLFDSIALRATRDRAAQESTTTTT